MEINSMIKTIRDKMRIDPGLSGDAQNLEELTWILFLKVYDTKENDWEFYDPHYRSIIPEEYRWKNWAHDNKDGKVLTSKDLLDFVDNGLFPTLSNLPINEDTPIRQAVVKEVFSDIHNYMKDGVILREVINIVDQINFDSYQDRHAFNEIYESMLREIQNMGDNGQYYTPRAVTDFMVKMIDPKIGESVADFACGTGGFLTSTIKHLGLSMDSTEKLKIINESLYGVEKIGFPYLLCITNMILHDLDNPRIYHSNSLEKNVRDYTENDKFDVIIMNPPYGGTEKDTVKSNFPSELRSSETADLFINVIMYRLKKNGRAAVIIPDTFLFGGDSKTNIKKKLLSEFNLHTVIRMTKDVFAPYTTIATNILFFDNTGPTKETWFYRMDMPEGYKHYSKTKPILREHFDPVIEWWNDRKEIIVEEIPKAQCYSFDDIESRNFDLDLCGFPHEMIVVGTPSEVITEYWTMRNDLTTKIDQIINDVDGLIKLEKDQPDVDLNVTLQDVCSLRNELDSSITTTLKQSILKWAVEGNLIHQNKEDKPFEIHRKHVITKENGSYYETVDGEKVLIDKQIPCQIPDSWRWYRVSDLVDPDVTTPIADGPFGSDLKREHYIETPEVRIIQLSNLGDGFWRGDNVKYTSFAHADELKRCIVEPGNLVIAKMMPAGRAVIVPHGEQKYILSSDTIKFIPNPALNKHYLLIVMNSAIFRNQIAKQVHGITRVRTSVKKIRNYLIPIPPIEEQQRIVERVNMILEMLD